MSGLVFDSEYGVHFVTPLVTLFKESPHFSVLDLHRKTRFGQQGASVCVYFQKQLQPQFQKMTEVVSYSGKYDNNHPMFKMKRVLYLVSSAVMLQLVYHACNRPVSLVANTPASRGFLRCTKKRS